MLNILSHPTISYSKLHFVLESTFHNNKEIFRYIIVGATGACVELGLFSVFHSAKLGILLSNFIAFHIAFGFCFLLHYFYTHENSTYNKGEFWTAFIKYAALMYGSLFIGTILLWIFIEKGRINVEISKFIQLSIIVPFSYFVQKYVIFKR